MVSGRSPALHRCSRRIPHGHCSVGVPEGQEPSVFTWPASPQSRRRLDDAGSPAGHLNDRVFEPHTLGSSASGRLADSVQSPRRECSPDDGPRFPATTATASPVQDGHPGPWPGESSEVRTLVDGEPAALEPLAAGSCRSRGPPAQTHRSLPTTPAASAPTWSWPGPKILPDCLRPRAASACGPTGDIRLTSSGRSGCSSGFPVGPLVSALRRA
jgi:hypothetical protein